MTAAVETDEKKKYVALRFYIPGGSNCVQKCITKITDSLIIFNNISIHIDKCQNV